MKTNYAQTDFTSADLIKLGKILEKHDDTTTPPAWIKLIANWNLKFKGEEVIDLIIDCFLMAYTPANITNFDILNIIYETPIEQITLLASGISIEDSREILDIFNEWRLTIYK